MATEPAFKTRIIHNINTSGAQHKSGLILRLPQPSPVAHCAFHNYKWTDAEAELFLADRTKLPRDLTTIGETGTCVPLWIFDASGTRGLLPALELNPRPMLERFPALCIFDMSGDSVPEKERKIALIPSNDLKMVDVGGNKVQFVLNGGDNVDAFTTTQAQLGAQMCGM